jgi:predicted transcriptional regulator
MQVQRTPLFMTLKLTQDQREAIRETGGPVKIEDDETRKTFVIIDGELHHRAMQALEEHETRRAIRTGIDDLEAGRVVPFAEVVSRLRKKLGLPPRAP